MELRDKLTFAAVAAGLIAFAVLAKPVETQQPATIERIEAPEPEPDPDDPRKANYVLVHSMEGCGACVRWIDEEAPKVKEMTGALVEKRTHEQPERGRYYPWIQIWDRKGKLHVWNYSRRDPWLTAKECAEIIEGRT